MARPKRPGGGYGGIATREVQRPSAPGRWAGESPHPPVGRRWTISRCVVGGMGARNDGQRPGLQRRGAPVKTQTCSAGYGRQARRRMRPDDLPTSRAVGTFDVCSNAAVDSDLSCFLYTGRLKRPYLHCRANSVA